MAPKKKPTGSPSTGVTTRSSSRVGTRSAVANAGSSARLVSLDDFPKKKKARKSSLGSASKEEKVDVEEEASTVAEDKAVIVKKEKEEEEENSESKTTTAGAGSAVKTIVIECCTQSNKTFKERATELKEGLEKDIPGIKVLLNPEEPRKGCFEVREEGGGEPFVSHLDMKRPFKLMKDLDMEKVVSDIVEKFKEV